ncbi:MAG: CvpA family protein [Lachnospiraceae bacterium]|nr:CvpA family protein [Lachnospiraceae bacterium]
MNLNLLLIIVFIVMVCGMVDGYKKGMVREIISFISLVITCVVVILLGNALNSYLDGEIINVIVMVLLLCVIGIVRHLLGVVFFSAKVISKLPIVHWVDKLLGIVVGILETVLIVWTMYTFVMLMDFGVIGQYILDYTEQSSVLTWLFQNNYLAYLVEQISSQISFLPL